MFNIAFIYNSGRKERLATMLKGKVPTEFFYGALELKQKGIEIGIHEINLDIAPGIFGGLANLAAEKGLLPEKLNGSALVQTRKCLKYLTNYDCVVATTSGIAFGLAAWKSLGFSCPPIVAIHCGLLNNSYSFSKRKLSHHFLRYMFTVLFGEGELKGVQDLSPNAYVTVKQFGVDINFWVPAKIQLAEKPYILAVGNDGRRDFSTLISAIKSVDIRCRILTKQLLPEPLPYNVEHIQGGWHSGGISDQELRTLYQQASCVVVPLLESEQPSGQSVTLQAMACGRPVILSKTSGLWYEKMMRDQENIFFVKPSDVGMLKETILHVIRNKSISNRLGEKARSTVKAYGNINTFADGILETCRLATMKQNME